MKLSELPNIGKELERLLNEVNIYSSEDLVEVGSIEAVYRLKLNGNACYNKLYAIEGAIQNTRWHNLSKEYRDYLKEQYKNIVSDTDIKVK